VWHLFVVRSKQRDLLQKKLHADGIQTLIHYPIPPHKQKAYIEMNTMALPISEKIHNEVISLPIGPHMQEDELAYVIDCINR
jgi:dTDP-4-amino-4,6-dideoxygalactose transaminase